MQSAQAQPVEQLLTSYFLNHLNIKMLSDLNVLLHWQEPVTKKKKKTKLMPVMTSGTFAWHGLGLHSLTQTCCISVISVLARIVNTDMISIVYERVELCSAKITIQKIKFDSMQSCKHVANFTTTGV